MRFRSSSNTGAPQSEGPGCSLLPPRTQRVFFQITGDCTASVDKNGLKGCPQRMRNEFLSWKDDEN